VNWCQLWVSSGDSRSSARVFYQVELRRFELLTSCMPYKPERSLRVARHRLGCRSPAATLAGRGLVSPGAWRCWLPTWLPENLLAALMFDGSNRSPTDRPQAQNGLFTREHYWYGRARLVLTHGKHPAPTSTRIRAPVNDPARSTWSASRAGRSRTTISSCWAMQEGQYSPQAHIPSEPVLTRRPARRWLPVPPLPRWTGSTPSAWRADPTLLAMTGRSDAHITGTAYIPSDSSRSDRPITERRVVDPRPATGLRLDR
jgi:hypothetical protein